MGLAQGMTSGSAPSIAALQRALLSVIMAAGRHGQRCALHLRRCGGGQPAVQDEARALCAIARWNVLVWGESTVSRLCRLMPDA
jgi:hypothetical protein